jgi:hypothetical protein
MGVSNSGKPVGNYEAGPAFEQLFQRALNKRFGVRIDPRLSGSVASQYARRADSRFFRLAFAVPAPVTVANAIAVPAPVTVANAIGRSVAMRRFAFLVMAQEPLR